MSFETCPIRASLGVLGRKWTLLVLRDLSYVPGIPFTQILRNNPGLTPRVLSMRLRTLREEGYLERIVAPSNRRDVRYRLTPKGRDAMPILTALIQFGIRHHAGDVFADGRPRALQQVFPDRQEVLLGRLSDYADASTHR
ncbi:MAG: winged helix-turn-helix transcriptional regulator [Methanobacteriota archaeon]